jgi:hypothetical protein
MSKNLIKRKFDENVIFQRLGDGYINLNQMANATGKRVDNWMRLQETQDLISQFEYDQNLHPSDLRDVKPALITSQARTDRGGGTWAHPDIAIQFDIGRMLDSLRKIVGKYQ